MTTYYVDFVNGLDANNGLGPDASHASNKPWKTITKALGAAGMASGDTAYLSPAGPFREVVTVAMTSAVAETQIIGDPANAQGFKTSGGVLVAPGDIMWTAYTTNDVTAPATSATLNTNARDYLTFRNIIIIAGNTSNSCVNGGTGSNNINFTDCVFLTGSNQNLMSITNTVDVASNWTFDRCVFVPVGRAFTVTAVMSAIADYDINILFRNSLFLCLHNDGSIVRFDTSGANTLKPGGLDILNCTFFGGGTPAITLSASCSTSIPSTIYNSILLNAGLSGGATGTLTEDYNFLMVATPRTNVSTGANSVVMPNYSPLLEFSQALMYGMQSRPLFTPIIGSPFLGFGNTGGPSTDFLNRPRPAGGLSINNAIGYLERHNTAAKETSVVDAGSNAAKIVGPGTQDLFIPVDASSTTITVRVRYDTNHATTNKPQATILNGEEIGVTTETKTAAAGIDTYETLTFSSFTPTAKGIVTLRLISRSAAGNGIAYFDTVTGGANGSQGLDYFRRGEPLQAAVASAAAGGGGPIFGGMVVR